MDSTGLIRIVGRIKEIIIRGGVNISAKEIEDVLMLHDLIDFAAVKFKWFLFSFFILI